MPHHPRAFLLFSVLCAVLAGVLLLPGLHGGFVFDDQANIVNNQAIRMETLSVDVLHRVAFDVQPGGLTRVLPTISFALDYWRGGLDPSVFKATNIAIHALTTVVLAWFLLRLLLIVGLTRWRASLIALVLALLWAVHPLQVSSVLYAVQRMQTMCTLFLVLALWAYLTARNAQIEGRDGRTGWLLAILCWVLALGSKEDAILLPAYTLALELTVLRFASASEQQASQLRNGYLWLAVGGAAAFLLLVVPHYWHSDAYPGRDFSTYERLLTQGRVLCLYLWGILLPLPQNLPFYYDWIQPSRGLLQPWTTLPALMLIVSLPVVAWRLRAQRPLFALGTLWFLAGHFVTSNVVGLELAFEHRNHFPLIGAVLAIGDLLLLASERLPARPRMTAVACGLLLVVLGCTTVLRAWTWGSALELASKSTEYAPTSARAWNSLCTTYFRLGGEYKASNPYLGQAIEACSKGGAAAPYSVNSLANVLIFRALQGTASKADWNRYLERLRQVPMTVENRNTVKTLLNNFSHGVLLDESWILEVITVFVGRGPVESVEYAGIGYFILTKTSRPDLAYPYFVRAVETAPRHSSLPAQIAAELRVLGRERWADQLRVKRSHEVDAKALP